MSSVNDIIDEIKGAANSVLEQTQEVVQTDIAEISGFSKDQMEDIAEYSLMVAKGLANGDVPIARKNRYANQIKGMVSNFLNVMVGVTAILIEKLWNAIVGVLQKLIKKVAGVGIF
jgi:hypothetical protein